MAEVLVEEAIPLQWPQPVHCREGTQASTLNTFRRNDPCERNVVR
jgi:hypothetical protein